MKLSVSLGEDDVAFIDEYAARADVPSRSAVVHHALDLLRSTQLEDAYREAWEEWAESGEAEAWESTAGDDVTVSR